MHDTITTNIITLLRVGAFGLFEDATIVDMSPHKWRILVRAAEHLNILPYIEEGAKLMQGAKHVSPTLYESLLKKEQDTQEQKKNGYKEESTELFNIMTNKRLNDVKEAEMNQRPIDEVTLNMLDIIISNARDIIDKDTNILGIITLGLYIRKHKKEINYSKLCAWITHIGMVQTASLEASMLVMCMGFNEKELPFLVHVHGKAYHLFEHSVSKVFDKHSFSTATRLNIAMLETISKNIYRCITAITDIEE